MVQRTFSLCGNEPVFKQPVSVGQFYFPSWERYKDAMQGIFERHYYTNQGPLTQKLEQRLQTYLGVKHAVCVTNGMIGLMMAAEALELSGKVILPSFAFLASAQSLKWTGIEPVFCDVDPETHQIAIEQLDALVGADVSAIMGVNLWGGTCDLEALDSFASKRGLKLYFDSAHAFGCEANKKKIANFGQLEVFSFHSTNVLSATEGGCVCTNDDSVAAKLRNIRSSYGAGLPVSVVKTSNGRMSEAQAAIALMSLDDFPKNQQKNEILFKRYREQLSKVSGIKLVEPAHVSFSNYQYVVCEVDEVEFGLSRDDLISVLQAENVIAMRYFYPGIHNTIGFKEDFSASGRALSVTEQLSQTCIQLPVGALVDELSVGIICDIISNAHIHAATLKDCIMEHDL